MSLYTALASTSIIVSRHCECISFPSCLPILLLPCLQNITDEDVLALVGDEVNQPDAVWVLEGLQVRLLEGGAVSSPPHPS